jgi:hypothetical protein
MHATHNEQPQHPQQPPGTKKQTTTSEQCHPYFRDLPTNSGHYSALLHDPTATLSCHLSCSPPNYRVSDVGGSLESGDLVTTSNIAPGYAQKQSDDIVRNYTVGKVTQECDFTEPLQVSVKIPKKELSNVKYYVKNIIREVQLSEYELYNSRHTTVETKPMYICEVQEGENHDQRYYYRGDVEVSSPSGETNSTKFFLEKTPDEYELLDDEEKAKYTLSTRNIYKVHSQTRSTRLIPEHEEEVFIEEMADVRDGNGQIVWEETDETEPIYTLVNHGTHKTALLTCKLD